MLGPASKQVPDLVSDSMQRGVCAAVMAAAQLTSRMYVQSNPKTLKPLNPNPQL